MPKKLKAGKNAGITDDIKSTIQNSISNIIISSTDKSQLPFTLNSKHTPAFCSGTMDMVPPCRSAITSRTGSLLLADKSAREKGADKSAREKGELDAREFSGTEVSLHLDPVNSVEVITKPEELLETVDPDDDKKKRRGRKPKDKFAFDDITLSRTDTLPVNDNNIVIKIPINYMELDKEFNISADSFAMPKPFERLTTDSSYKYLNDGEGSNNTHATDTRVAWNANPAFFSLAGESNSKRDNGWPCLEFNANGIDSGSDMFMQQNTHNIFVNNPSNEIIADLVESNNKKQMTQVEILLEKKYKHTKQISLLSNICVDDVGNTWHAKTQCACYWDCHCFDHQPWGIPTKYNYLTGQFTMFGNFCSPNCAMSYLLTYETNTSSLWEKISLLNLLYYKVYENDDNIIPAPDKICIKLFGGPFDINEFRALTLKNNKIYTINFPPCNIITPVLEETKKVYNQESYFIPNDKKKHNKIQTELKIKRTRPITTNKNTIDSMLNKLE